MAKIDATFVSLKKVKFYYQLALFYIQKFHRRNLARFFYTVKYKLFELFANYCELLGIRETSLSGRSTLNERSIRRSTSTLYSAKIVIDLVFVIE